MSQAAASSSTPAAASSTTAYARSLKNPPSKPPPQTPTSSQNLQVPATGIPILPSSSSSSMSSSGSPQSSISTLSPLSSSSPSVPTLPGPFNPSSSSTQANLQEVIVAGVRLDEYHPTLNTGLSDIRIQNVILENPIVRALIVPECDMEARRRCMALLSKILLAASPVIHAISSFGSSAQNNKQPAEASSSNTTIPSPSPDPDLLHSQTKSKVEQYNIVISMIAKTNPANTLVLFWLAHLLQNLEREISALCPNLPLLPKPILRPRDPSSDPVLKPHVSSDPLAVSETLAHMPTPSLYAKLLRAKNIIQDLADRIQGAVCMVFWESWDDAYELVAEVVGPDAIAQTERGRIFRPSGNAALYINRKKLELREQERNKQRLHIAEKRKLQRAATGPAAVKQPSRAAPRNADVLIPVKKQPSTSTGQSTSNKNHPSTSPLGTTSDTSKAAATCNAPNANPTTTPSQAMPSTAPDQEAGPDAAHSTGGGPLSPLLSPPDMAYFEPLTKFRLNMHDNPHLCQIPIKSPDDSADLESVISSSSAIFTPENDHQSPTKAQPKKTPPPETDDLIILGEATAVNATQKKPTQKKPAKKASSPKKKLPRKNASVTPSPPLSSTNSQQEAADKKWPFRLSAAPIDSFAASSSSSKTVSSVPNNPTAVPTLFPHIPPLIDSSELEDLINGIHTPDFNSTRFPFDQAHPSNLPRIGDLQMEMHERHTQASDFESVLEDLRQTAPSKAYVPSAFGKQPHSQRTNPINSTPPPQAGPQKRGFSQLNSFSSSAAAQSSTNHHTLDEFSYLRKRIRLLEEMEDQENSMSPMPGKPPTPVSAASSSSSSSNKKQPTSSADNAARRVSSSSSSGAPTPGRRESSFSGTAGKIIWDQLRVSTPVTSTTTVKVPMRMRGTDHDSGDHFANPSFGAGATHLALFKSSSAQNLPNCLNPRKEEFADPDNALEFGSSVW